MKDKGKKEIATAKKAVKQAEQKPKPKSKIALFWEKYPDGYMGGMVINDMSAVMK
ncbi:MAG: hypothetical protein LBE91_00920 [Tannerella sp.]|jgi:hypothetical protein|nr:hypothetical protein [Tannerella sp.]